MVDAWITDEMFNSWMKDREKEQTKFYEESWQPKERGTTTVPKVYEGRFLPDLNGTMYKKYFYHMYQNDAGEWIYVICPKTYDFQDFCPLCYVTTKLYQGSEKDKELARKYKRKYKYVGNFFVVNDPRDSEGTEEDQAWAGKVYMYDFPSKLESKLAAELKEKDGLGKLIFDPGQNGFNFLIKVKTTGDGPNSFPEYSDSCFARKASALGTNKEIAKIMETRGTCVDWILNKFKENNWVRVKDSIVEGQLWTDSLRREWEKHMGQVNVDEPQIPDNDDDDILADQSEPKEKSEPIETPVTPVETENETDETKAFLESLDKF